MATLASRSQGIVDGAINVGVIDDASSTVPKGLVFPDLCSAQSLSTRRLFVVVHDSTLGVELPPDESISGWPNAASTTFRVRSSESGQRWE